MEIIKATEPYLFSRGQSRRESPNHSGTKLNKIKTLTVPITYKLSYWWVITSPYTQQRKWS